MATIIGNLDVLRNHKKLFILKNIRISRRAKRGYNKTFIKQVVFSEMSDNINGQVF